jgi:hypothetical protein
VFEIQAEFVTLNPSQPDDNPLNAPATFAWSNEESSQPYFIDESTSGQGGGGVPVVNAAGDTFENLPTRDRSNLVITVGINSATHDPVAADLLSNTTNQDPITLDGTEYDTGTLRLKPISAVKQQKTLRSGTVVTYYAKTLTFLASHQGWHDHPLNIGFNELVGSATMNTQQLRKIVDANGNPVAKPWPLDPSGHKLQNPTDPPQALDFLPYAPADWSNVTIV